MNDELLKQIKVCYESLKPMKVDCESLKKMTENELLEQLKESKRIQRELGLFVILGGIGAILLTVAVFKFLPW